MLQSNRLTIRNIESRDLDNIHELHSLPETDRFNTLGIPETVHTTELILEEWLTFKVKKPRTSYIFCIESKFDRQFIGLIALNLGKENYKSGEVWYKTNPVYWGNGYTTEALIKVMEFGFNELGLHRIEAGCAVDNIASIRVLEKVGMTREGMKRQNLPIRGEWKDNYFYAILDEEFNTHNEKHI
jgi:RimJ/RimL family protein N-acetyltransferase